MGSWLDQVAPEERRAAALLARLINQRGAVPRDSILHAGHAYATDLAAAGEQLAADVGDLTAAGLHVEEGSDGWLHLARESWELRPVPTDDGLLRLLARAVALADDEGLSDAMAATRDSVPAWEADTTVSLSPRGSNATGQADVYSRLHRLAGLRARGVTVGFGYPGASGEVTPRALRVYGLGEARGVWYAVGREPGSEGVRAFAVSEMRGPVEELDADGSWSVPGDFDVREYLAMSWRLGADPVRAVVRFDDTLAAFMERVLERMPLMHGDDGSLEAHLTVGDVDAFVGWVASFGTHARILSPDSAAIRAIETVREVANRHA